MGSPLKALTQIIDEFIRRGNGKMARAEIRKLEPRSIPRELAVQFASLARRASLPATATRILHPIVRGEREATDAENAEYAASLTYLGASDEALQLLHGIDQKNYPIAMLYEAFALFSQWNYKGTLVLLENFVRSPGIDEYQRLVGKVNLAAALVYERLHEPAGILLDELLEKTSDQSLFLLKGNALELSAQNEILQRRFTLGEQRLFEARAALRGTSGLFEFFVRKWTAVLELLRDNDEMALSDLRKIRFEALERKHFETARDCDHFEAIVTQNENLLWELYFGSPFDSFRRRLLREYGMKKEPPTEYFRNFRPGKIPDDIVDITRGIITTHGKQAEIVQAGEALPAGSPEHRLLFALAKDFYSPIRLPALFGKLFPDKYYHPSSSTALVSKSVKKLREWLETADVGITIREQSGYYDLWSEASIALKVPRETPFASRAKSSAA